MRQRRLRTSHEPIIDRVLVDPDSALSAKSVRARMELRAGEQLDTRVAGDDLERLYGLRLFQRVEFELQSKEPGHADLLVRTEDLSTAPLHWSTGMRAELSAGNAVNFQIGAALRYAPIDAWGSEARVRIEAGNTLGFSIEYRQALERSGCSPSTCDAHPLASDSLARRCAARAERRIALHICEGLLRAGLRTSQSAQMRQTSLKTAYSTTNLHHTATMKQWPCAWTAYPRALVLAFLVTAGWFAVHRGESKIFQYHQSLLDYA